MKIRFTATRIYGDRQRHAGETSHKKQGNPSAWGKMGAGLLMAIILPGWVACSSTEPQQTGPQRVRLYTVGERGGVLHQYYPGRTQAAESSRVAFKVGGTLKSVPIKVGDHVRRGQTIALMDDHDYQVQLKATRAEYESTKAECERIIALYQDEGTSANNYDKARYGLEQISQKLRHAEDQVNDCRLTAPFDGYVQDIYHEQGETVGAGMAVAKVFSAGTIEIVINVPASDYQRRNLVDKFSATFDALPGQEFPLTLHSVSAQANVNQLYEVHLSLHDGASQHITPGMTAMVDLQLHPIKKLTLQVPTPAVWADVEGHSYVFVYTEVDSKVHARRVQVATLTTDGMAIVAEGLQNGDRVVSSGVHHLRDGETVSPSPTPSKTNVGGIL